MKLSNQKFQPKASTCSKSATWRQEFLVKHPKVFYHFQQCLDQHPSLKVQSLNTSNHTAIWNNLNLLVALRYNLILRLPKRLDQDFLIQRVTRREEFNESDSSGWIENRRAIEKSCVSITFRLLGFKERRRQKKSKIWYHLIRVLAGQHEMNVKPTSCLNDARLCPD